MINGKTWMALVACAALGGCANFKAVSEFAHQTTQLTGVVRAEFRQVDALCREQAELTIVINGITDEGPLSTCQGYKASQGRLATLTLDVLDDYARALGGLADDKAFDLAPDIESIGAKLDGLKSAGGQALASPPEVAALTKLAEVLAEVFTARSRDAGVRRLVEVKPDLAVTGRLLRSFFVADPQAPGPRRDQPPYANLVGLTRDALASSEKALSSKPFQEAEPIRTAELLRGLRERRAMLDARTGTAAGNVPTLVASALDAWLAALDDFSEDALRPEPKALLGRLKDLRAKASAARGALRAAND